MEPGSKQDGAVNMTRAMEALSPLLNHPRRTITQVEGLVLSAAALLLLQLILGSCRRRWHNSFIKYGLQVCNGIMFPLTVYTLGTMQSSPVKNSVYPIWAGFLIMASAGTTTVRQYDFYDSFYSKYIQAFGEYLRDFFYATMFTLLLDPSNYSSNSAMNDPKQYFKFNASNSSYSVMALVYVVLFTKFFESIILVGFGYRSKWTLFVRKMKKHRQPQDAETRTEENGNDPASYSDPQNMKDCKYEVIVDGPYRLITIDQIWEYCVINASYGKGLKDLCLSYAFSRRLLRQRYFGIVYSGISLLKDHDFVFKKLLPPQGDFKRAFRIIEIELGFCYDFFFTKYCHTFINWMHLPVPFIQSLFLLKIFLILVVGVMAISKSLVLETPSPIIEVHISKADYIITILVLSIALLVELVQAASYLASNWAQVSLACMHVKKCCREPKAYIFGKLIGLLRWVMISQQLKYKIDQHSVIFQLKQQPDPKVSDVVKTAIATSLRSTYAKNLTTNEEASVRMWKQILGEYSYALNNLSQLEIILIWHIATEYCNAISIDLTNGNGTASSSNHRGGHLFGYVLQWLRPDPTRNMIASDSHGGVAVHLSRYYAYLIGFVPELLPYHEVDVAELAQEVMEEREELFKSLYEFPEIYNTMKSLPRTQEEEDSPTTMFNKGVKLGKQLEMKPDRWEVLQHFWAKKIIQAAASHYTTKQHMQHLENGGEFLTHIWALLAHAGILVRDKDQQGQGVRIPEPHVQVTQEANLRSAPSQAETVIHVNDRRAFSGPL